MIKATNGGVPQVGGELTSVTIDPTTEHRGYTRNTGQDMGSPVRRLRLCFRSERLPRHAGTDKVYPTSTVFLANSIHLAGSCIA